MTEPERAELIALADELAARLVERALVKYLDDARPWVAQVLYATGVLEVVAAEAGPAGSLAIAHTRARLRRDRLLRLVTDPLALMRDVHRWGEPDFDGVTLLRAIAHVWERVLHRPAQLLLPPGEPSRARAVHAGAARRRHRDAAGAPGERARRG